MSTESNNSKFRKIASDGDPLVEVIAGEKADTLDNLSATEYSSQKSISKVAFYMGLAGIFASYLLGNILGYGIFVSIIISIIGGGIVFYVLISYVRFVNSSRYNKTVSFIIAIPIAGFAFIIVSIFLIKFNQNVITESFIKKYLPPYYALGAQMKSDSTALQKDSIEYVDIRDNKLKNLDDAIFASLRYDTIYRDTLNSIKAEYQQLLGTIQSGIQGKQSAIVNDSLQTIKDSLFKSEAQISFLTERNKSLSDSILLFERLRKEQINRKIYEQNPSRQQAFQKHADTLIEKNYKRIVSLRARQSLYRGQIEALQRRFDQLLNASAQQKKSLTQKQRNIDSFNLALKRVDVNNAALKENRDRLIRSTGYDSLQIKMATLSTKIHSARSALDFQDSLRKNTNLLFSTASVLQIFKSALLNSSNNSLSFTGILVSVLIALACSLVWMNLRINHLREYNIQLARAEQDRVREFTQTILETKNVNQSIEEGIRQNLISDKEYIDPKPFPIESKEWCHANANNYLVYTLRATFLSPEQTLSNLQHALGLISKAIDKDAAQSVESKEPLHPEYYSLKARISRHLNKTDAADEADRKAAEIRADIGFERNLVRKIQVTKLVTKNLDFFDDITWEFKPGINILLGKNGYGKSHLFGLLIALLYEENNKRKDWIKESDAEALVNLYLEDEEGSDNSNLSAKSPNQSKKEVSSQSALPSPEPQLNEKYSMLRSLNKDLYHLKKSSGKESGEDSQEAVSLTQRITKLQGEIEAITSAKETEKITVTADRDIISSKIGRVPILGIPDTRFIDKSEDKIGKSKIKWSNIARDGAYDFLYLEPYSVVIKNVLFESCLDLRKNKDGQQDFNCEPFNLIKKVIKELSSDKLVFDGKSWNYQDDSRFEFIKAQPGHDGTFTIIVRPEDSNLELPIQKLSQGTFSVIAICCIVYNFLAAKYQNSGDKYSPDYTNEVLKQQAIVFIDEIDAHIHPSWQGKLINIFRQNFPNIQFIITAHSPIVIRGCRSGEVSVLRRTKNNRFTIETIQRPLMGMTIESLFNLLFETESRDGDVNVYKEKAGFKDQIIAELSRLKEIPENALSPENSQKIINLEETIALIDLAVKADNEVKKEEDNDFDNMLEMRNKLLERNTDEGKTNIKTSS